MITDASAGQSPCRYDDGPRGAAVVEALPFGRETLPYGRDLRLTHLCLAGGALGGVAMIAGAAGGALPEVRSKVCGHWGAWADGWKPTRKAPL